MEISKDNKDKIKDKIKEIKGSNAIKKSKGKGINAIKNINDKAKIGDIASIFRGLDSLYFSIKSCDVYTDQQKVERLDRVTEKALKIADEALKVVQGTGTETLGKRSRDETEEQRNIKRSRGDESNEPSPIMDVLSTQ